MVKSIPWPELIATLAEHRSTLEAIHPAVVSVESTHAVINTAHPAWITPAPAETMPPDPRWRWREIDWRSSQPVIDPDRELQWIASLANGLSGPCKCREHWAAAMEATPPTIETPERYWRWYVDRRNDINIRNGKPRLSYEAAAAARPIWLHCTPSCSGIGDVVCGLYMACGLADATGRPVVLRHWHPAWVARASHPGVIVESIDYGARGVDYSAGWDGYHCQIATAASRSVAYCDNVAAAFNLAPFKPRRPGVDRRIKTKVPSGRYVVLAPFANYAVRGWPSDRWRQLAKDLVAAGLAVHAIGSHDQQSALAQTFGEVTGVTWHYGRPVQVLTDLMLASACTVANDSGIAHVAGLLSVPTVAVHAGSLPHSFLFDLAPSVLSVTADFPVDRSAANEPALRSIGVDRVLAAVMAVVGR